MEWQQDMVLVKRVVNELAIKKAGTNCSGFMYEVKKPQMLKAKNITANHKK